MKILHDIEEEKQNPTSHTHDLRKFELAVEQASIILYYDPKGFVLVVNNAAEKLTGFSREEIVGKKAGTHENWGGMMDKDFIKNSGKLFLKKKIFMVNLDRKKKRIEKKWRNLFARCHFSHSSMRKRDPLSSVLNEIHAGKEY